MSQAPSGSNLRLGAEGAEKDLAFLSVWAYLSDKHPTISRPKSHTFVTLEGFMAKRKIDLSTPAKRSRLPKRRDPHWHFHPVSGAGTHLGWRSEFNTWTARYHPPGGKRQVESLGSQPDFETAWAKAVEWFDKKAGTPPSRFTVGHALSNYADHLYDNNPEITYISEISWSRSSPATTSRRGSRNSADRQETPTSTASAATAPTRPAVC